MFARIVEFSPTSEAAAQFVQAIHDTVLGIVKAQDGCITAYVELMQDPKHLVLGVSVWNFKSDAERYGRERYPDIENMLRPFLTREPRLHTFEVRKIADVVVRVRAMAGKRSRGQTAGR